MRIVLICFSTFVEIELTLGMNWPARPVDPVLFNIYSLHGRGFVMCCLKPFLRNNADFIFNAGQFFAPEEPTHSDSISATF